VGTALMNALYQIFTRKLAGKDEVVTSLFYPALVGSILVPLAFPAALTLPREPLHALMFLAVGALGGLGHFLLIRAYNHAPATVIGPFVYAQLLSVIALGWLVFGQLPDLASVAGMLIIVGSGLLLLHAYRRPAPPPKDAA
jgi:drug/metabolite transporter (DMT)-like permease